MVNLRLILVFFLGLIASIFCNIRAQEVRVTIFRQQGEGTGWSPDGKRIAYDLKGAKPNEYYEIHTADTNGADDTCISCICKDLPQRHTGSPDWHPSGKYIILVTEKAVHPGGSVPAIPGFGGFTDIWVMTPDGKHAWKVLETRSDPDDGIIAPKFSHDGKRVVWVERKLYPNLLKSKGFLGYWTIRTADFVVDASGPKLENIKTFEPKENAFYETYGFSADDKKIMFCSNMNVSYWWLSRIYTMDANTGQDIKEMTNNDYNEHAVCSRDGKWIVWMSNSVSTESGTDWWIMRPDGTQKQRLTYFNEPAFPQYSGHRKWAGLVSFSPDNKKFIGGVQYSLLKQEGGIYMVEFLPCGDGNGLKGEYFSNGDFSGIEKIRNDPAVNFRWGPSWNDTLVNANQYSIRWTGYVQPLYSEPYSLYTYADKNTEVWLNDTLIIGPGTPKIKLDEKMVQLNLDAGKKYKIKVEYHNQKQNKATAVLIWSSAHQYKQLIPASQLFSDNK